MAKTKIPHFYGLRIYLTSTAIYYLLILPFLLMIFVKNAHKLEDFKRAVQVTDSTSAPFFTNTSLNADSIAQVKANANGKLAVEGIKTHNPMGFQFTLIIISFGIAFLFNLPFRLYFRALRKKKAIKPWLRKYSRKLLLLSPILNALILFSSYIIAHAYTLIKISTEDEVSTETSLFYGQFFYVSLVASLLSVMFAYFWQRHRVHIRYLEYIYSPAELRHRIFKGKHGKIKNQMWLASGMTTLLPLLVVIIYLVQSITNISELQLNISQMSPEMKRILYGDIITLGNVIGNLEQNLFYINAVNAWFMFLGIYSGIFIALFYIFFFVKWTTDFIVQPVKELLNNMMLTGNDEQLHYTIVRTNDEIGQLARGYNDMSARIHNSIANIRRLNESYLRFVPKQFLDMLGKQSITEISLGDQVQKDMCILFTDIRDFTSISESMTLQQNFDFINNYLGLMEPIITRNHGFIDKFMGDSIMALFEGDVENAVNAAIEMQQILTEYNQLRIEENLVPIAMGIGIHSGSLMLGIIGGHGRMEGTVISDAVNLSSRLEGLTKHYGSSIIISQDALIKIKRPEDYFFRFLDVVKVKGKKHAAYIFEILNGESPQKIEERSQSKHAYIAAIESFRNKDFQEAASMFKSLSDQWPTDKVFHVYSEKCKRIMQEGIPHDWDGAEIMQSK
ncbi:MAG: adenylate/guanylate cyclase domain-containing protein [Bacteroidales bacterium]|nr:adenylate/guanylate cyclase domain-containing protein [Bacteroidales bacterium]